MTVCVLGRSSTNLSIEAACIRYKSVKTKLYIIILVEHVHVPFVDPPSLLSGIGLQGSEIVEPVSSSEGTAGVLTATGIGRRPEEHLCTAMRHTLWKMFCSIDIVRHILAV